MSSEETRERVAPEHRAIVPTRRPIDLASMQPNQQIVDAAPQHAPVRRVMPPEPQELMAQPQFEQYTRQWSYYREVTYWSSETTYSGGGVPGRSAPAALPAAESQVGFVLTRGIQLVVWVSVLAAIGYFGGRALGWW